MNWVGAGLAAAVLAQRLLDAIDGVLHLQPSATAAQGLLDDAAGGALLL